MPHPPRHSLPCALLLCVVLRRLRCGDHMNRAMNRVTHARTLSLAVLAALAACSGGDTATPAGTVKTGGSFVVLQTDPVTNGRLYLNDPVQFDFSNPVNLETADLNTVTFQAFDQLGNALNEQMYGTFALAKSPGDTAVGRRLQFIPTFPTRDGFDNGSFKPGRTYLVQVIGGDRINGTAVRDTGGKILERAASFRFSTAEGTTPAQLFRNSAAGGPRRAAVDGLEVGPREGGLVVLNKQGQQSVEVRLNFDQPLNPNSNNVPVAFDGDPLVRDINARGRVFLEYDDPVLGTSTWIPTEVELESNRLDGATLVLRPIGVLPNHATIRVIVESSLEDISGESNVANAAYQRVFGTFETKRAYEQQFDAIVEDFADASNLDLAASFAEPVAEVGPGYVKAGFAFEGTPTNLEFEPLVPEVVLNTNFTQVTPKVGPAYNVSGGVFNFKRVRIPQNTTVRGQGTNPMVWLVSGNFEVEGTLTVRGGDGTIADSIGSANFAKPGGYGACGGGDGGAGSPSGTLRDEVGGTGNGPLQQPFKGGTGGRLSCFAGCNRGSGGGGGALATQGDPNYKSKTQPVGATNPQPIFQQQTGTGGQGCTGIGGAASRQLGGGTPGAAVFVDSRDDNNYWGSAINFRESLRITGELSVPIGGGGGGGGGDLSYNLSCTPTDVNFANDGSGGGGGGGGGVLIVKALGDIIIKSTGRISADGGSGAAGELASSTRGGGGGGGAGGMVVLMSASRIEINVHGGNSTVSPFSRIETYAQNDYDFSISADGGVCVTGGATAPVVRGKYPSFLTNRGAAVVTPVLYDSAPLGGLGGMGIVQLMAPPGSNADGTNTVLDDNIIVRNLGTEQTGAQKKRLLAWRGWPNASGILVGDDNVATAIGDNEGDIRPAPILMPVPFSAKSRVRTKWIDSGASVRRALTSDDSLPRGIVDPVAAGLNATFGPFYEFAATTPTTGYVSFSSAGGEAVQITYPTAVDAVPIQSVEAGFSFLGQPAYRVQLASSSLGDVVDRYSQYEAELLDSVGSVVGSFRILSHTNQALTLSPSSGPLPQNATSLRVRAKFFQVITDGAEGLGPTYRGSLSNRVPTANIRIGFAFHRDPSNSTQGRYPTTDGTYLYDLSATEVQDTFRQLGAAYVQFDILFDCAYRSVGGDEPPVFGPASARPELHFLRLPFRF